MTSSFSTANNFFLAERKNFPSLLPSFSYRLERSFHFSRCCNAIFAFKASLVRFTFSRIFKVHKNFRCWIYFRSNGFAWCFRWFTIGNNLVQNWKCQWGKNVSVRIKILKSIVENRASFTSEQVIVSYPREILSQPLWKSYSYVGEFLSFPTMWQRNVSFQNFLCLFPYFWNWIKNRPGSLTLLSAREFSSNRKFMMLSLLTFTIFNFLMAIPLEVLFLEKDLVCFQKWSRLRIVPFPSVCRAWHEKWSRESVRP